MNKIAVMGYGIVGSGVVEVFYNNRENIEKKAGDELDIKYILDLRDFEDSPYRDKFIKSFEPIINDDEVGIVAEVMGGINPSYDYVKRCLMAGKSVVTSNKELVAQKGAELLRIATENNVNFLFEASVGGGIPVIRPIAQCLSANNITEIFGILNGTTNFMLTKMINEGMSYETALKLAQDLGYAESNPSADVDGHDSCRKICILSALSFGKHVYPQQVSTEGISGITLKDAEYAGKLECVIKLIAHAKHLDDGRITASVYPAMVPKSSQLSSVDDVFNAVLVKGDAVGDVVFYGRGAGKLPTASAVAADIIDCAKHVTARKNLSWEDGESDYVDDPKKQAYSFFVLKKPADIKNAVLKLNAAIPGVRVINDSNELAFITPIMSEYEVNEKLALLGEKVVSKIRILSE